MKFSNKSYKDRREQTRGQHRNWQKARLAGFHIDGTNLTPFERSVVKEIEAAKYFLLKHWDNQTEVLLGKKLKPHKCWVCGRRSTIRRTIWNNVENKEQEYCLKHFNLHINIDKLNEQK